MLDVSRELLMVLVNAQVMLLLAMAVALKIREIQATSDVFLDEAMNTSEMVSRFSGIPVPTKTRPSLGGKCLLT